MTLKEIVKEYLEKNGYGGLFNPAECACKSDDLFPCDNPCADCEAGHLMPCDCGDHDWHIGNRTVTREMALDAGDPSLEGSKI